MAMDERIVKALCHCIETYFGISFENAGCVIHMNFISFYNHFDCLILVYKMILSVRQVFQGLTPNGCFIYLKCWNLENINILKTHAFFWSWQYTEYLSVIVDNGTRILTSYKFAVVRNWFLPKTQKHIKYFVQFCPFMAIVFTNTLIVQRN